MSKKVFSPAGVSSSRLNLLRVRHLKLLELIAQAGSLTGAADLLHISQPGASKMLHELEEVFGCALVDRNTRAGVLSLAGQRVLERMRIATGALEVLSQTLSDNMERPLVRVGMLPLAGISLIPRLVSILLASDELPRMHLIEGSVSKVMTQLRHGQIDCVIGRAHTESSEYTGNEFDIVPLSDEHFEVACGSSNPLARSRKLDLHKLHDQAWIVPAKETYTRQVFNAAFVGKGMTPPQPLIESASFHTSLATVSGSHFLTIAPRSAVDYYAKMGKVRKLHLLQPFETDYSVFITLKNSAKLPVLHLLQSTLQKLAN